MIETAPKFILKYHGELLKEFLFSDISKKKKWVNAQAMVIPRFPPWLDL